MKALVYTATNEVRYRDEPDPQRGTGEALVRIDAVGICGSDMHAYHGHDPRRVPPLILGHEACGVVETGTLAGRRVVLNPLMTCGVCEECCSGRSNLCRQRELIGMNRPGAFAERIAIPEQNLIPIPEDMDPVHAALTEPGATALHAIVLAERVLHRPVAEARALVIGGGSVGLLAALFLKSHGCQDVLLGDTNALRRATAEATGACRVYDPISGPVPDANGYDFVIDAVGGERTRPVAISAVKPGGVIAHIGLMDSAGEVDVRKLTLSEITFFGTYTYTTVDLRATVAALSSGALGSLDWVEQRPLADGAAAFDDLDHGRSAAAKVVLLNP
jgi:alcohol dehydrogenase